MHNITIDMIPSDKHIISLSGEFYYNKYINTNQQILADLKYTYKIPKKNIEIELKLKNIFNRKYYNDIYQTTYTIYNNRFNILRRQVLCSLYFKF